MNAREFLSRAAPYGSMDKVAPPPLAGKEVLEATTPVVPALSLRSNFIWVLSGNAVYAVCQWCMIVVLAKLGNAFMVGQFSLALAIATPVLTFSNLHLRVVQATDAKRLYSFAEYLHLRGVMTLAAITVIAGITWFGHYERRTAMVILAIALAKGIETLSDIHYGLFQLNDRLDQTGRSAMLRGVLSVSVLGATLYVTHDILWGCIGLALVWLAALVFFDVRRGRCLAAPSVKLSHPPEWRRSSPPRRPHAFHRQRDLMRLALPLGVVTTMASVNLNMPRYFIHSRFGEHQLGIFSAMAYAALAMTLVSDSLGHCALPRLSRLYAGGRLAEFRSLLLRLLLVAGTLGLAGVLAAHFMGARLLTIFYSREYAAHYRVFILLVLAIAIHCVAGVLTSGILSARCFRIQVPMFALVAVCSAMGCARWVPTAGLAGGAAAMAVAATVHLVLAAAVVGCLLSAPAKCAALHSPTSTQDGPYDLAIRV
jgi:O-antigen/teichoic acid export membrane protein